MLGRRRPLSAARLVVGMAVAAAALAPLTCAAQTSGNDVDLLQPSLNGNPANPPRFRRSGDTTIAQTSQPPTGAFMAPSRIGATPVYGSPTGFGAGDTGFNSKNTPRGKRIRQQSQAAGSTLGPPPESTFLPVPEPPPKLPVEVPAVRPEVHPARAAARPGAVLPPPYEPLPVTNPPPEVHPVAAANRPGAVLPIPPPVVVDAPASTPPVGTPQPNILPLGTPPPRPLPIAAGDPYEALGIKAGSFLILPALELSAGYDNNPQHIPGGGGSAFFVAAPELHVRSDWPVNALTADITGTYTDYNTNFSPSLNRPYLSSKIDGRIDATRDTQILLENRVLVTTDNPGSPNLTAGLAKLPIDTTVGGTVGVVQDFNRIVVSLKGSIDSLNYQNSQLTDGTTSSNADRDLNQYAGILRVGYGNGFAFKPFVEVGEDTRIHEQQFDRNGQDRDSDGTSGKVGIAFDAFGTLTGEMAVGYVDRVYKDPALSNIQGLTIDGSVTWQATALTTAKISAVTTVGESILENVSGSLSRDVNIEVDHALRRWLVLTAKAGYGNDDYVGLGRDDNRYFISGGLTYKFNRVMQMRGELRQDWLTSNVGGVAYDATSVLLTLRLQR